MRISLNRFASIFVQCVVPFIFGSISNYFWKNCAFIQSTDICFNHVFVSILQVCDYMIIFFVLKAINVLISHVVFIFSQFQDMDFKSTENVAIKKGRLFFTWVIFILKILFIFGIRIGNSRTKIRFDEFLYTRCPTKTYSQKYLGK